MKTKLSITLLALMILGSSGARADVTVEMIQDGGPALMMLGAEQMRMEDSDSESEQVILFDGSSMTITILHPSKKTYQKIDKSLMEGVGSMMDDMMKMMEKQLEALPPEQRRMVKEQMKAASKGGMPSAMPGGFPEQEATISAAEEETYEATGDSKQINGFDCRGHRVMKNGQQVGEVWTASLKEVGLNKSDLAVFAKFGEFASSMSGLDVSKDMNFTAFNPLSENFIGLPILQIDGDGERVTEVKSIEKGKISADKFKVPSGYSEESLMEMMPSGH